MSCEKWLKLLQFKNVESELQPEPHLVKTFEASKGAWEPHFVRIECSEVGQLAQAVRPAFKGGAWRGAARQCTTREKLERTSDFPLRIGNELFYFVNRCLDLCARHAKDCLRQFSAIGACPPFVRQVLEEGFLHLLPPRQPSTEQRSTRAGRVESSEMVRPYAHPTAEHLEPYA